MKQKSVAPDERRLEEEDAREEDSLPRLTRVKAGQLTSIHSGVPANKCYYMFMSDHGKFKINVDAVITNTEGRLLILRQEGKWKLPGGRMEEGETPTACLAREVEEETGISDLIIGRPINVGMSESGSTCLITFQGHVESNPSVNLSNEHDQYAWTDSSSLDQYEFSHNAIKEIIRSVVQPR